MPPSCCRVDGCGFGLGADRHDPCAANLPGVRFACCGYGSAQDCLKLETAPSAVPASPRNARTQHGDCGGRWNIWRQPVRNHPATVLRAVATLAASQLPSNGMHYESPDGSDLNDQLGSTGRKTGFWLEELAAPYYVFKDAGAQITWAAPKGGRPPLDPKSEQPASRLTSLVVSRRTPTLVLSSTRRCASIA